MIYLKFGKVNCYSYFNAIILNAGNMQPNGPAIWGGCVGALKRHGALFAVMVQILLSITRVAVQV